MTKKEKIERLERRLELYLNREEEMLTGGVQSYGLGTRNVTRYNTELAEIRKQIDALQSQIEELSAESARKAVAVVPRDF